MGKPDAISRQGEVEGKEDNKDVVLLSPELFRALLRLVTVDVEGHDSTIIKRIKESNAEKDHLIVSALLEKDKTIYEHNGLIYKNDLIYIPRDKDLRADIIKSRHDPPPAGHPGQHKTLELVSRDFWWPTIRSDVSNYVRGCQICQRVKYDRTKRHAPLYPHDVPSQPFEHISVDFIGPLPPSEGFNMICVVTCQLSKAVIYIPCQHTIDSEGFARLYHDNVYAYHGMPRKITSDRGSVFVSKFTKALYKLEGIQANTSTAYHPITDGQTERNNQEVETYLRIWISYHQDDWVRWLRSAMARYNNMIHSSTGHTPFFTLHGYHPYDGYNPKRNTRIPAADDFAATRDKIHEEVKAALAEAKRRMKEQYDKHKDDSIPYEKGQLVWLSSKNYPSQRPSQKLEDRRYGPFKIVKKVGRSAYKLQIPQDWKRRRIHDVFNESILLPYVAPYFENQMIPEPPPPVLSEEHSDNAEPPEWEVEAILDSRWWHSKLQYFVHWKGYPRSEDEWVNSDDLFADELVEQYHQKFPKAPPYNSRGRRGRRP